MLKSFELALRINFHKTKIVRVEIQKEVMNTYAKTLNCNQIIISFTYLCLPIRENLKKTLF